MTVCGNCGTELAGSFCHACGQKAVSLEVGLKDLGHEAFHEFAHVDGKIVQTLKVLVTKPGLLTKEFLDGRRKRYISPVRLYLTCSLLFFALAAVAPVDERPFLAILVHLHLSLHRVFGGSWFQTIWKGMFLWFLYLVIVGAAVLVLGLRAAYTILPTG